MVGGLEEERSTLVRFPTGGIGGIRQYAFHRERVAGVERLRLPRGPLCFGAAFVDRVPAGMRGVGFRESGRPSPITQQSRQVTAWLISRVGGARPPISGN
jgi:hypothetical protein